MVKVRVKGFAWQLPRQQRFRLLTAQPWVTAVGTKPAATRFFHTVMHPPAPPLCVIGIKVVGMGLKNGEQGWMSRESNKRHHLCFQQQAPFAGCHYFCDITAHTWLANGGQGKQVGSPGREGAEPHLDLAVTIYCILHSCPTIFQTIKHPQLALLV